MSDQPEILCFTCVHRRTIPGNVHIRCAARAPDSSATNALLAMLNPKGFGWLNFDPCFPEPTNRKPITACEFYQREGV